jgi:hypothetical protein
VSAILSTPYLLSLGVSSLGSGIFDWLILSSSSPSRARKNVVEVAGELPLAVELEAATVGLDLSGLPSWTSSPIAGLMSGLISTGRASEGVMGTPKVYAKARGQIWW